MSSVMLVRVGASRLETTLMGYRRLAQPQPARQVHLRKLLALLDGLDGLADCRRHLLGPDRVEDRDEQLARPGVVLDRRLDPAR